MVMDMSESKAAFQVKTGPVRVSGYAIKLRKAINGVLSDYYKQGKCSSKAINESISDLNKKIYEVIVDKYKVPKEAVTNIVLDFDVEDNKIIVKDILVEIFDKVEMLSKTITEDLKSML